MTLLQKITASIATAILISSAGSSVHAQIIYSEDANGLTAGTSTLQDSSAVWSGPSTEYGVLAGGAVFADNHFELTAPADNFNFANWEDGNLYGVLTLSIDVADTGGGSVQADAGVRLAARRETGSDFFDVISQSTPDNTVVHYDVVINTTTAAVMYDDGTTSLAAETFEVWRDGSLVSTNSLAVAGSGSCTGFGIWSRRPDNAILADNIVIRNVAFNSPSLVDPNAGLYSEDANGLVAGSSTLRDSGFAWNGPATDYGVVAGGAVFTDNHFELTIPDDNFNFANFLDGNLYGVLSLSIDLADTGGGSVNADAGVRLAARRETGSDFFDVLSVDLPDNTIRHIDIVINTTASAVTYDDGVTTIGPDTLEVWQDGVMVSSVTPTTGVGACTGFGIWARRPDNAMLADNIEIRDSAFNSAGGDDVLKGDVNLDGSVTFLDINPFIVVLSSNGTQAEADCDCNGVVNFLDIQPFIDILAGN